jgi:hypothetical protein
MSDTLERNQADLHWLGRFVRGSEVNVEKV